MNKYVVGYFSDHDGELLLEEVDADDKHAALIKYLDLDMDEFDTEEKIYAMLANSDATANVIQINKSRSGRSGNGLQIQVAEFDSPATFH